MVPRQSRLTRSPLRPRFTRSIDSPTSPVVVEAPAGLVAELTAPYLLGERRRRAGAALQQAEGLGGGGEQDPVDDEAVDLLADQHRDAADTAHEVHRGTHRLLARPRPADHLAELHHGDRMG